MLHHRTTKHAPTSFVTARHLLSISMWMMVCVRMISAATYNDSMSLMRDLFHPDRYNNEILPLYNQSRKIDVHLQLMITSINSLDDITQKLEISGVGTVWWPDEVGS